MTDEKSKRHQERMQQRKEIVDAAIARADQERGIVIVLTGDGKGKSSSGFGTALRCLGHGFNLIMRHVKKGRTRFGLDALQLDAQVRPQFCIE